MFRAAFLAYLVLSAVETSAQAQPLKIDGVLPTAVDGRPLNLDFETGDLRDWIAEDDAFVGQPIKGDTV